MNAGYKKRPEQKPADEVALTAFVEGQPPDTVQGPYPWQAPYVREDVIKIFNLRLTEPDYLKLKYIVEHGMGARSMHQFVLQTLRPAIDQAITDLTEHDQHA